jgi:hypothetical protein
MHTKTLERMTLTKFFVFGYVTIIGACLAIEHAQAQFVNPVPPPPPPVFNPSSPYTVTPPPYRPISPGMPGTLSGSGVGPHFYESPPSAATHSHRRVVHSATIKSKVAPVRWGHRNYGYYGYHRRSPVVGPSYYPPSFGYVPFPYNPYYCTWQREWDGYWWHRCF